MRFTWRWHRFDDDAHLTMALSSADWFGDDSRVFFALVVFYVMHLCVMAFFHDGSRHLTKTLSFDDGNIIDTNITWWCVLAWLLISLTITASLKYHNTFGMWCSVAWWHWFDVDTSIHIFDGVISLMTAQCFIVSACLKVRHQEHSMAVDFWGLGVLIYELSYGTSPFQGVFLMLMFFLECLVNYSQIFRYCWVIVVLFLFLFCQYLTLWIFSDISKRIWFFYEFCPLEHRVNISRCSNVNCVFFLTIYIFRYLMNAVIRSKMFIIFLFLFFLNCFLITL